MHGRLAFLFSILAIAAAWAPLSGEVVLPGTQPLEGGIEFGKVAQCQICHGDTENEIGRAHV